MREASRVCPVKAVEADGITRVNVFITTPEGEYKLPNAGAPVHRAAQEKMLEVIRQADDLECLVVSGSLSPEMDSSYYDELVDVVRAKGAEFVLDVSDGHLANLVEKSPLLIKPNDEEVAEIFGVDVSDESDIVSALHAAQDAGIHVGPASGRGREWIPPFFRGDQACCSTMLATNGLQVYLEGELIHEEHSPHDALESVRRIVEATPGAGLLVFDGGTPLLVAGTREDLSYPFPSYAKACRDVDGVPDFPVVKSNVFLNGDDEETYALIDLLNERVDGLDFDFARTGFSNIMTSRPR